jgi:hypothetical protein
MVHLAQVQQAIHGSCNMDKLSFHYEKAQLSQTLRSAFYG